MKKVHYLLILIPIIFVILVFVEKDFVFRAGVSGSCALILILAGDKNLSRHTIWLVIAALLVSIPADWFLCNKRGMEIRFVYGIALFFLAHCGYLAFTLKNGKINKKTLIGLLTVYLIFFIVMLMPSISNGVLLAAVLMYLIISCLSVAGAVGLKTDKFTRWIFAFGIGLLAFSDTIIALKEFGGYREYGFLILPTYFASHIVVTLALMKKEST